MSGGVRNVTIRNCVANGTENGARVKTQRYRKSNKKRNEKSNKGELILTLKQGKRRNSTRHPI